MTKYKEYSPEPEFIVKAPWGRIKIFACLLFALSASIGFWYVYEYHYLATKEIPLLAAEEGPTKIKPEKADGALVPHMDKMVYESLKPGSDTTRLVSIMPEPEQPITITSSQKDAIEDIVGKILSDNDQENVVVTPEALEIEEKAPEAQAKTLKVIPVDNHRIDGKNQPSVKAKSFYKAQLVSVRTQTIAEKEWDRLKKTHHKSLGELHHSVQKISTKDHGVFYRLLVGKFATFGQAKALCKKLVGSQQTCIVVRD